MSLCNHRSRGDRTSISVWCSHVSATPAYGNQVRTHCQVTTAPEKKRKKAKKPLLGVVCLLTTGGLISVRRGLGHQNTDLICNSIPTPVFVLGSSGGRPPHAQYLPESPAVSGASVGWGPVVPARNSPGEVRNIATGHASGQPPGVHLRAPAEIGEHDDRQSVVWKTGVLRAGYTSVSDQSMAE